jgi:hypothetical protein
VEGEVEVGAVGVWGSGMGRVGVELRGASGMKEVKALNCECKGVK